MRNITIVKNYYHIRKLNDELCSEHQLSVISPTNQRGKKYKEWLADSNGSSWKAMLKNDIDEAIQTANTYEDFLDLIRAKGYEVKGENFDEYDLKYIAFRPLDRDRFTRGSVRSLGTEYTRERIKERIEAKALEPPKKRVPFPTRKKPLVKDYSSQKLIDTSEEKFEQSPGLKHWADIQNLKIAASSYSRAGSIAELEKQIETKSILAKTARSSSSLTAMQNATRLLPNRGIKKGVSKRGFIPPLQYTLTCAVSHIQFCFQYVISVFSHLSSFYHVSYSI